MQKSILIDKLKQKSTNEWLMAKANINVFESFEVDLNLCVT